ncbi:MAG: hypothetical protein LBK18_02790, partial [Prevotellaceae bacterium]|nr:hypothetical protein [Prevotellaceae bacterium]
MKATLTQLGTTTKRSRALALCASTIMALTLWAGLPLQASAETQNVSYINESGQSVTEEHDVTELTNQTALVDGWYIVTGNVTISSIKVNATNQSQHQGAHLILADNSHLTVNNGINVIDANQLTIYAQSTGESMGKLTVVANQNSRAGIGGNGGQNGGIITINGGLISATGHATGAAIGAGNGGSGVTITINGGVINAQVNPTGAGGTGADNVAIDGGSGGTITITGGTLNVTGGLGNSAGGIGVGDGGTISIENAIVFVSPAVSAAATYKNAILIRSYSTAFYDSDGSTTGSNTVTLTGDYTIPAGKTLTIPAGKTLVIDEGATLNILGSISVSGTLTGDGTVTSSKALSVSLTSVTVNGTYTYDGTEQTPDLTVKLAGTTLALDADYTISTTNSVNAGTAARYTITGKLPSYSGTKQGTFTIGKAAGASASAPAESSRTHNTVTLNEGEISTNPGNQTVEYAKNTENAAPSEGWQTGLTFNGLSSNTPYYFFARAKENDNYFAGAPSSGTQITTNKIPVNNSAKNLTAEVVYSSGGIDLATLYNIDVKAGAQTYTKADGTGTGSIGGSILTVTKSGTFQISLATAETATHAAGLPKHVTLTVEQANQSALSITNLNP